VNIPDSGFSFLHVADLHLDSPLRGLSRYEGAPVDEIRGATREALTNMVEYVLENGIPLVVLAGDIYDADCPDFQTLLHFAGQMSRLGEQGVQVVMIRGNHDADNPMTSALHLPDNVVVLPSARPGTWHSPTLPVAVHGQSYPGREILDNLVLSYPTAVPGVFNIGLLHTAMTGRAGHAKYAPCSVADLTAKGYHYWALGHVHEFELVSLNPHVVYSGCLQGRHVRETGAKGCVRVDVDDFGQIRLEQVKLDVLRWTVMSVDVSGARKSDDLRIAVITAFQKIQDAQDGRLSAVRVRVHGRCPLHAQIIRHPEQIIAQIKLIATDASRNRAWVERVFLETTPDLNLEEIAQGSTPQAGLLRSLKRLAACPDSLKLLGLDLRDLQAKLGASGVLLPDLDDPDIRDSLLRETQDLLIPMLVTASSDQTDEIDAH
jgi:DNA repair protein SbcD/Mre11